MTFEFTRFLETHGVEVKPGYSIAEVAVLSNVTEQSIRLYLKQGRLKATRTSPRKWGKIPFSEAERFFAGINGEK
jgi:hypothetical protein